jgi:NAD(P)-dependent dehydrogenase (short-subunit alcohol dehydrogenase family)
MYVQAILAAGGKVLALDRVTKNNLNKDWLNDKNICYIDSDITKKESLKEALNICINRFGTPTGLINNAAIDSPPDSPASENGPFEEYPIESFKQVMDVNVTGTLLACQVFGSAMAIAGYGSIINVASIYGKVSPDQSIYEYRRKRGENYYKPVAYSVSKSSLYNLTRYLAIYWAKKGVRVNTLTLAGVFNRQDADFLKAYIERIPMGRMATPSDYIGPVLFLISDTSCYMTGSDLVVDGGWTAI